MKKVSDVSDTKVSVCFDLQDVPYLQSVLDAIDAVHTDGALPRIRVRQETLSSGVGGFYDDTTKPPRVTLARQTLNADMSFLHKIGHFIDHQGMDRAGEYASVHSPLMEDWRNAVQQSASIAELEEMRQKVNPTGQAYIDYLLSMKEAFARCYVQYIAFKSQHPGLVACLRDDFLNHSATIQRSRQWQESDFVPIANALDDVFGKLRWIP